MTSALSTTALEILCDGLSDGVVIFRAGRTILANDGACELLGTQRAMLAGAETDEILGRIGLPEAWLLRLRAGDPVTTLPLEGRAAALRLRWINLPPDGGGDLGALVIQDMRLGRALRRSEDALALRTPAESDGAPGPLPSNEILSYLSSEVRRCHLDFEELSVLVGAAGDTSRAAAISTCIAAQLRGGDRVGPCDPLDRPKARDSGITIVNFPATAMPLEHVLVVLPCTTAAGRDALAMRLRAAVAAGGHGGFAMGVATLQVRTALRAGGDRPRDGARALLERALGDLASERAEAPTRGAHQAA